MTHETDHLHQPVSAVARKDVATLRQDFSVQQALDTIRQRGVGEKIVYFYVVDAADRLAGVLPTRRLLTAPLEQRLADVMITRVVAVPQTATVLEACEAFVLHKFLAFPVVDDQRRIIGVVDVGLLTEEAFDIAEREQTDALFESIGFRVSQVRDASPVRAFRFRFPWLLAVREFFGPDAPLAEIDAPQIAAWRDARARVVSGSTVVREANLLRNVFNVARLEWHWTARKPFEGIKLPQQAEARQQVWRWQLIKRLLRAKRIGKTREVQDAFHISLRTGMRLAEVLAAPAHYDPATRVVTVKTKTEAAARIPIGRLADKLLRRKPFVVQPNEASVLFSKLCRELLITGLTFHDARATALTHLAKKVDVMTLAKISRHKDLSLLMRVYYRPSPSDIARSI
jgi:CBS domain-containing protein/integrase